ncbi:hypothetical protein cypCar_00011195 [Cyprinus carpio]|nr:hypothetical protein cypCar_00011195 [Cyprinus carpio]
MFGLSEAEDNGSVLSSSIKWKLVKSHNNWYQSQTGPWGRCMGSECGPGGSQSRAVWCAHSEGWTTLHTNCQQSERPSNQQNCFRVCDWHKELYDWQLGAWNQCLPVSMRSAGMPRPAVCTRGEEGIQTREVGCVHKSDGVPAEDAICEYFEPKPRLEQACLIPCPRNCVVSEFSPWTSCSKSCGMGLQNRLRWVLAPPLFGGSACPNLTEFRTCHPGPCEGEENLYSLRVGSWGPCIASPIRQARDTREDRKLKPERKAKRDRQARQERQGKRRKNKEKKEVKENKGERVRDRVRVKGRMRDSETRELIKKKRTRNRLNRQGLKFWDLQVGYQTREVTCVHRSGSTAALRYNWRTTEWSDCRVDVLLSQQDRRRSNQTGLCGGGVQTREVYCVQAPTETSSNLSSLKSKDALRPVNSDLCLGVSPNTTQLCHIPCPVECEVSSWGAWGPCTFENCQDQSSKKGAHMKPSIVPLSDKETEAAYAIKHLQAD